MNHQGSIFSVSEMLFGNGRSSMSMSRYTGHTGAVVSALGPVGLGSSLRCVDHRSLLP